MPVQVSCPDCLKANGVIDSVLRIRQRSCRSCSSRRDAAIGCALQDKLTIMLRRNVLQVDSLRVERAARDDLYMQRSGSGRRRFASREADAGNTGNTGQATPESRPHSQRVSSPTPSAQQTQTATQAPGAAATAPGPCIDSAASAHSNLHGLQVPVKAEKRQNLHLRQGKPRL